MKTKFKYKFTPMFIVLFVAGLLLGAGCIISNSIHLVKLFGNEKATVYNYITRILPIIIGILAFVFIIPAIISSNYQIEDGNLVSKWGVVKNKMPISTMTRITVFRKTDKIVVFFEDESYLNICIDKQDFEDFSDSLKAVNNKIFYSLETDVDQDK